MALVYNGISHVVMLATPADLEDFALGFSLTEGILASPEEMYACEIVEAENGIRIELDISSERFLYLKERRRNLAGRTGMRPLRYRFPVTGGQDSCACYKQSDIFCRNASFRI